MAENTKYVELAQELGVKIGQEFELFDNDIYRYIIEEDKICRAYVPDWEAVNPFDTDDGLGSDLTAGEFRKLVSDTRVALITEGISERRRHFAELIRTLTWELKHGEGGWDDCIAAMDAKADEIENGEGLI